MLSTTNKKSTPKKPKRKVLFPGICAAARTLGVSRVTLYLSLTGRRPDLRCLRRRYESLKSKQLSTSTH